MRRESIFWGIILLLLGTAFLLDNLGLLPVGVSAWEIFWPLLLISLGIMVFLRATRRGGENPVSLHVPLGQAQRAKVNIKYGAGELRIDDRAGTSDLVSGSFGGGVEHSTRQLGDDMQVDLRMPPVNWPVAWPFTGTGSLNWTVGLNPDIALALDLEIGASRNLIDLRNLNISELRLSTGASSSTIDFPERAGYTAAWLKSGAAAVDINIPTGVAARIRTRGGLASIDVNTARFPRLGGEYQSPDYATADNRVDLDVETGVGSVRIR